MTLKPGRADEIARAVTLGKARKDVTNDAEERDFFDTIVRQVAVIGETGGIVELAWDHAGTDEDYLAELYRDLEPTCPHSRPTNSAPFGQVTKVSGTVVATPAVATDDILVLVLAVAVVFAVLAA